MRGMDFYSAQGEYDEEDSGGEEQEPCPGGLRHATGIGVPRCVQVRKCLLIIFCFLQDGPKDWAAL